MYILHKYCKTFIYDKDQCKKFLKIAKKKTEAASGQECSQWVKTIYSGTKLVIDQRSEYTHPTKNLESRKRLAPALLKKKVTKYWN